MPDDALVQRHLLEVRSQGEALCSAVKAATGDGVPDALLLPALIEVFREAGMLPDLDFSSLLGMLR